MAHEPVMTASIPTAVSAKPRLEFIDNLRWLMILLVISMHAAVTYSHLGSWYFMEDPKPGTGVMIGFATYQVFLQAFFMGFLFLIAGYFVPAAFDRKGFGRFLRDRAIRLGIPSLFYMLVIHPLVVYWMLKDYYKIKAPFLDCYRHYITSLRFLGSSGPMWFTVALLVFCLMYGLARLSRGGVPHNEFDAALPTHSQVAGLALVMGLCTFLVRTVQPMGTNILNMQLCYFSQYILLFSVGILAWRRDWLLRVPYRFGMRWFLLALVAGGVVWFAIGAAVTTTHSEHKINGGFTWQSAELCFWEAFVCLGICLGLTVLYRDRFNRQGPAARWMSDNCFSVYLFHTPFLIAVTLLMHGYAAPKPVKFLYATILGAAVTWLASSLVFRRIPLLKRVL
jgi:surface polysaccharide O-acyltransferase-like enzyme